MVSVGRSVVASVSLTHTQLLSGMPLLCVRCMTTAGHWHDMAQMAE